MSFAQVKRRWRGGGKKRCTTSSDTANYVNIGVVSVEDVYVYIVHFYVDLYLRRLLYGWQLSELVAIEVEINKQIFVSPVKYCNFC